MSSQSDLPAIKKRGTQDHAAGLSYFDNPFYFSTVPTDTVRQLIDWSDLCNAWSAGWLEDDDGRDERIRRLQNIKSW
jgi:hypothetical protein